MDFEDDQTLRVADIAQLELRESNSIRDAIAVIDRQAVQIALVTDANRRLIGTITDGDIRRALLRGENLDTPLGQIMNSAFHALPAAATERDALALMLRETLHQIPALDSEGRVVRLFLLEELLKRKHTTLSHSVVIMAGGKGQRLYPLTQDCPKPMLRVGGKPLLEIILEQCIDAGFRSFFFAVNYLKEQIQAYFGDGTRWDARIDYLEETRPLGTAGALSLLAQRPSNPLLVINGDVLTRIDYRSLLRFHAEHQATATICVREHTTQIPYGVVHFEDINVLAVEEKPVLSHYVNAGIYLLEPVVLDLVPSNQYFDMTQLLELILLSHRVSAFPIHEYWLDVGLPRTLEQANGEWLVE